MSVLDWAKSSADRFERLVHDVWRDLVVARPGLDANPMAASVLVHGVLLTAAVRVAISKGIVPLAWVSTVADGLEDALRTTEPEKSQSPGKRSSL